jgi:hypothetical protein
MINTRSIRTLAAIVAGAVGAMSMPSVLHAQQAKPNSVETMEVYRMTSTDTTKIGTATVPRAGAFADVRTENGRKVHYGSARILNSANEQVVISGDPNAHLAFVATKDPNNHTVVIGNATVDHTELKLGGRNVHAEVVSVADVYRQGKTIEAHMYHGKGHLSLLMKTAGTSTVANAPTRTVAPTQRVASEKPVSQKRIRVGKEASKDTTCYCTPVVRVDTVPVYKTDTVRTHTTDTVRVRTTDTLVAYTPPPVVTRFLPRQTLDVFGGLAAREMQTRAPYGYTNDLTTSHATMTAPLIGAAYRLNGDPLHFDVRGDVSRGFYSKRQVNAAGNIEGNATAYNLEGDANYRLVGPLTLGAAGQTNRLDAPGNNVTARQWGVGTLGLRSNNTTLGQPQINVGYGARFDEHSTTGVAFNLRGRVGYASAEADWLWHRAQLTAQARYLQSDLNATVSGQPLHLREHDFMFRPTIGIPLNERGTFGLMVSPEFNYLQQRATPTHNSERSLFKVNVGLRWSGPTVHSEPQATIYRPKTP